MSPQTIHQFAEKVALVSDAASPIGRAVAMQLALQGSYVVGLFPRAESGVDTAMRELVELGTLANGLNADPSTFEGARKAAAEVDRLYGRLDLLVNCLKFRPESTFETITESAFLDTVGRNLGSVHFLTQSVLGLMKNRPKPKVVNVITRSNDPVFEMTQAGTAAMTRSLAARLPGNFRINYVEVSETETEKSAVDTVLAHVAPDDAARAVLFLLSSESKAMNGRGLILG